MFVADTHKRIVEGGIVGHRQICRQGPGRRRPDKDGGVGPSDDREFHVHTLAHVIFLVFHFCAQGRERRAADNAPQNRFFATIDKALFDDVRKEPEFLCFVFLIERKVWISPVAEYTQPFELLALDINVFAGVCIARFANSRGI